MKKKRGMILLAFLGGILLANLSGKELLTNYGILNSYYLNQYTCHSIDCDRLFCIVLLERMKAAFFIVILRKMIGGKHLFYAVESILGAIFGFLTSAAIANLGIAGLAVIFGGIFPQWIFYQAGIFLYAKYRAEIESTTQYGNTGKKELLGYLGIILMLAIIFLIGVVAESYLNPFLFDKILKIF